MIPEYPELIPFVVIFCGIFIIALWRLQNKYWRWIADHWFYRVSLQGKCGFGFYIVAIVLMMISLLDWRGFPQKNIAVTPSYKTIIMIDASTSMLAEDVFPNRFLRAIVIARHVIQKASGHQISLVVFSDQQRRVVPFTSDQDFLDSKLDALEQKQFSRGGSNIEQAVLEASAYFKVEDSEFSPPGNILLLTDGEELGRPWNFKIGSNINLAVVGIGTNAGAMIPLRNERGQLEEYLTRNGEKIITKLGRSWIRSLEKKADNFAYWLLDGPQLPSDELISFLQKSSIGKDKRRETLGKPVVGNYLVIMAVIFYVLSVILRRKNVYLPAPLLTLLMLAFFSGYHFPHAIAQESVSIEAEMNRLLQGKSTRYQRLLLAQKLLEKGEVSRAVILYRENTNFRWLLTEPEQINFATALLLNKQSEDGFFHYFELLQKPVSSQRQEIIRKNILYILKQQQGGGNPGQDQTQNQQEEANSNATSGSSLDPADNSGKQDQQYNKQVNIPAMIKKILSDDRLLQSKNLEIHQTKASANAEKDW